jgi:hypothetical protein
MYITPKTACVAHGDASVVICAGRDQFHLVHDVPPAGDAAREGQSLAQIVNIERYSLQPHDAILRHDAHVIGKDVPIIVQRLLHLRRERGVRLSARGNGDFLAGHLIVRLKLGCLRQGRRPGRQSGHSQRRRQE